MSQLDSKIAKIRRKCYKILFPRGKKYFIITLCGCFNKYNTSIPLTNKPGFLCNIRNKKELKFIRVKPLTSNMKTRICILKSDNFNADIDKPQQVLLHYK